MIAFHKVRLAFRAAGCTARVRRVRREARQQHATSPCTCRAHNASLALGPQARHRNDLIQVQEWVDEGRGRRTRLVHQQTPLVGPAWLRKLLGALEPCCPALHGSLYQPRSVCAWMRSGQRLLVVDAPLSS